MSNHNKIRPVDKNNLNGKYKILFSTPQTKNSNIPIEFRGLQIYNNKALAIYALKERKRLTKVLEAKRAESMKGNKRLLGNPGGDKSNLIQFSPEVQKLKNAKIKRAQELFNQGYIKSEILRMIIKEFKLDRNINSRAWPKWLSEIEQIKNEKNLNFAQIILLNVIDIDVHIRLSLNLQQIYKSKEIFLKNYTRAILQKKTY